MTALEAGSLIAGRYRLEEKIGAGGMGAVWRATDEKLRRKVAVKLVAARSRNVEHVVERFVQEATSIAKLKSPHIVEIHDFGFDDLHPYLVMELLRGESLSQRLAGGRCVTLREAQIWAGQLGKALTAAHTMGIIHRDLKPGNVFLVADGEDEILKVFDFGIAKALDRSSITAQLMDTGALLGTPGFMSPEQLRGDPVDGRADLWALGVILYQALTGRMPFEGNDGAEVVMAVLQEDPEPPSRYQPELPAEIDAFFPRALAKEAANRFQNARELVAAFRAIGASAWDQSSSPGLNPANGAVTGPQDAATASALAASSARPDIAAAASLSSLHTNPSWTSSARPWGMASAGVGAALVALLLGGSAAYLALGGHKHASARPLSPADAGLSAQGARSDQPVDDAGQVPAQVAPAGGSTSPAGSSHAPRADASTSAAPSGRAPAAAGPSSGSRRASGAASSRSQGRPKDLFTEPW